MQHKAALGLHRPALHDGLLHEVSTAQGHFDLVEQFLQVDIGGFVDDQPQCATLTVLTQIHHAAGKLHVLQPRHGDEEVVGQIDGRSRQGHGRGF